METKHLRQGNLLFERGESVKLVTVREIREGKINGKDSTNFEPIQLTSDRIKKLGFVSSGDGDGQRWSIPGNKKCQFIYERKPGEFTFGYQLNPVYVRFVHQLQNIYFFACEYELVIKG